MGARRRLGAVERLTHRRLGSSPQTSPEAGDTCGRRAQKLSCLRGFFASAWGKAVCSPPNLSEWFCPCLRRHRSARDSRSTEAGVALDAAELPPPPPAPAPAVRVISQRTSRQTLPALPGSTGRSRPMPPIESRTCSATTQALARKCLFAVGWRRSSSTPCGEPRSHSSTARCFSPASGAASSLGHPYALQRCGRPRCRSPRGALSRRWSKPSRCWSSTSTIPVRRAHSGRL
jgi:hypothetical protein